MGQVISIILGRLFGGKKKLENVKPKTGHEEYSPLPSYYIDIIEEQSHKGEDAAEAAAATPALFHPRHRVVPISPQQQAVLDPPVEDDLHQPLITANSFVTDTGGAEETKELILEATSKEAISIDGFQWTIDFTRIIKSTEEESFHPHHHPVTVSQRQQQQHHHPQVQEQEDVSEPLVEVDFHQPLIATNSIVTDTAGVKGGNELILKATTKEPNSTKRFKRKIKEKEHVIRSTAEVALHPHHHVVTVSQQQRHHQQQEQEVVSDPLVEVDLHQPLITTKSIVANTGGVEETKKLTLKATTKETTSTKRFEWKIKEKEPIIKSTAEEAFHPHHQIVTVSQHQQQQHHHHQQQHQEEEVVSDPLVEVDLHNPLITTNSIATNTARVEETKELILKATTEEATSTKRFKWKIKEKEPIIKSTAEEAFHPHHQVVTVSQHQQQQQHHHQQQHQEEEVASDPLVEVDLDDPLITTNSIATNTARVEETKELILKATTEEATSTKRLKWKIKEKEPIIKSTAEEAFHPHHDVVTVPQQQQQQQHHHHRHKHQEEEVVLDPLVDVDLHDPLITTNSVATNTARVEETKELILKATTEEATSTKRFKWKIKEKEPIIKSTAEEAFHPHHQVVTVSQHQQQQQHHQQQQHQEEEVVSDPLVEVDLHNPLITTNSIATNTARVEETKELILKATTEEATSTKRFKWKIKEKKSISKSAAEEAFHPRHHVVTISQQQQQQQHQQQQHQEEEIVSDPLVEVDLHNPLITTNSIVNDTVGVEETKELIPKATTKEATPTKRFMWKIKEKESISKSAAEEAFHPRHHVVTISQQQQHQQQRHQQQREEEEQEVVSIPLVDVDLHKPLIRTNSIVTDIAGVEETKELILKATTEEATSTKRFKRKIEEKNHKNEKPTVRKIGPYVSTQKILLVGEGDFSFSASLAVAFGNASNIVATSLDEKVFLMNNYGKSMVNIEKLKSRGALVIHNVDATEMAEHKSLQGMKFDRIIFNFPHTCYFGRTWFEMGLNQTLVVGFLRNAKKMIEEDGEIHVTHKTSSAYIKWHIVQLGLMEDLNLIEASPFDPKVYPGYKTKYGYRGDKNFHYFPCNIYKFGLVC